VLTSLGCHIHPVHIRRAQHIFHCIPLPQLIRDPHHRASKAKSCGPPRNDQKIAVRKFEQFLQSSSYWKDYQPPHQGSQIIGLIDNACLFLVPDGHLPTHRLSGHLYLHYNAHHHRAHHRHWISNLQAQAVLPQDPKRSGQILKKYKFARC
jgi:hypothetical protein